MTRLAAWALLGWTTMPWALACSTSSGHATAAATAPDGSDASVADTPADHDAADAPASADCADATGAATDGTPAGLDGLVFDPPIFFSAPIEDYLEAGFAKVGSWKFLKGIHDLTVYLDRLYFGYGDANENLGRVFPIEVRLFAEPQGPCPARNSEQPCVASEFAVDEEQIDHYRHIGEDLWIAGVDATEDAWLGNVYFRTPTSAWVKRRTVVNGVHVHDVAGFGGAIYAVGSGATPDEWKAGNVYGHLWKSTDAAASWTIVERTHNKGAGDARWTNLLAVGKTLWIFGYKINAQGQLSELPNATFDGTTVTALPKGHALSLVFVTATAALDADRGAVVGADVSTKPVTSGLWRIDADGTVTRLEVFADRTVLDLFLDRTRGQMLVLSRAEALWALPKAPEIWSLEVHRTANLQAFTKVLQFGSKAAVLSMALWRDALYFGTDEGLVLVSRGHAP